MDYLFWKKSTALQTTYFVHANHVNEKYSFYYKRIVKGNEECYL